MHSYFVSSQRHLITNGVLINLQLKHGLASALLMSMFIFVIRLELGLAVDEIVLLHTLQ